MTALLAILFQVGPPAPCAEPERLPYGAPAACTGGYLVPRKVVEGYVAAPRICAERVAEERKAGDARVKACSAGVEALHAALSGVRDIFEASQADDVKRLIEAEAPACPWYECPGWSGVGLAFGMGAALAILEPWSKDPQWGKGGIALAGAGMLWWLL